MSQCLLDPMGQDFSDCFKKGGNGILATRISGHYHSAHSSSCGGLWGALWVPINVLYNFIKKIAEIRAFELVCTMFICTAPGDMNLL